MEIIGFTTYIIKGRFVKKMTNYDYYFLFLFFFWYQALSNCRYKSLLHQAIVNCEKERVSIASYCYPSDDAEIGPAKKLIDDDHPAIYNDFTYKEFHESMWRVKCSTAKRLDLFKAESD